ncbi:uncharacterized protein LOC114879927 [Osmia bicornis bicornis]|uniref:uncharacterized protein LOC114879927 n=1 Tax=Osmia bicornis bicornis TaxID=1437191 RepID=UPI001EAE8823|nr:uncharacterized protein LOC114879927 [Osmia bicornis bicornis]XP_029051184.2 uncharacterized protein LOC114879927 [Osmia bicornis bicornis]XP_029051185.2 uncharacterized protein LOC114879927 [Osmia bicornis bicornis]XP_046142643.1 uncharacterized protein LOC114879927 [Osmia bicornis bicornis]
MKCLFLLGCLTVLVNSQNDDWVWRKDEEQQDRLDETDYRYQVNENPADFDHERPLIGFRPQNSGPYGPNSRPIVPASYPGNKGVLVGPGGPTGIIKRPSYSGSIEERPVNSAFLPSSIKDDTRYQDYDVCRCRYSFNCPSFALKFGSCSKDKKFCCFNSKKYPALVSELGGGQYPPHRGPPQKYGPAMFAQSANYYGNRRPQGSFYPGNRYPGNYHSSGESPYPRPHGNPYEENYDYDIDLYSRSLKRNQTDSESSTREKA